MAKKNEVEAIAGTLTVEQLVGLGYTREAAEAMVGVADTSSGGGIPFPLLKKSSEACHGFNDLVLGMKKEKGEIVDEGTNFGTSCEIIYIGTINQLSRFEDKKKGITGIKSNLFAMNQLNDGFVKDLSNGKQMNTTKAYRNDNDIKWQKVVAGLIRKDSEAQWEPFVMFMDGSFLFSAGDLIKGLPQGGCSTAVQSWTTKIDRNGAVQYAVLDLEESGTRPLTIAEIGDKDYVELSSKVAQDFSAWISSTNAKVGTPKQEAPATEPKEVPTDDMPQW